MIRRFPKQFTATKVITNLFQHFCEVCFPVLSYAYNWIIHFENQFKDILLRHASKILSQKNIPATQKNKMIVATNVCREINANPDQFEVILFDTLFGM
jgi:hypothetical protein